MKVDLYVADTCIQSDTDCIVVVGNRTWVAQLSVK